MLQTGIFASSCPIALALQARKELDAAYKARCSAHCAGVSARVNRMLGALEGTDGLRGVAAKVSQPGSQASKISRLPLPRAKHNRRKAAADAEV